MKLILFFIGILLIVSRPSFASDLNTKINQLDDYLKKGEISKSDYKNAKEALIKLEEIKIRRKKTSTKSKENLKKFEIRKFKRQPAGSKEFEKMEMIFSDFRIYTHRPGAMKIKRRSDNKQLAVIGDKLKIKYYNNSKDLINFEKLSETKSVLRLGDVPILTWELRTVKKHQANFYQVMALGSKPFHYYIVLYNRNKTIALNYSHFNKQIQKAIDDTKIRLASVHNVSIAQIETLMKKREEKAFNELQKLIGKKKDEVIEASINDAVEEELEKQLEKQLEAALGSALANEFNLALEQATGQALDQAVQNELAAAIDETIAEAISMGISEAAIAAGIAAALAVLAAGGSEAEAIAAGEAACGC
ncbi:hypothetical protein N9S62_02885 [Pelagibacteraceae bacterium]|nr:hypothetical protein [Pelagibacteraceae bacterium]